jgi:N-carbamoylputrescine amidase
VGEDRGGAPGTFYIGESLIIDPRGEVIGHGSAAEEDLVWADLDLELLHHQRKIWLFFNDRRPDQYGALVEPLRVREKAG